jgi:outer membrane lipoprotein SlyB
MHLAALLPVALLALPLVAHGSTLPNTSGRVYTDRGALTAQQASLARVVAIRPVQISIQPNGHTSMYVGTAIGAATGYAVTRNSSGSFRGLGTIVGGAAGGAIGNSIDGVQIFVQTTNNAGRPNLNLTAVVQDADPAIRVGDNVLLIRSRDGLSVAPTGPAGNVGADTDLRGPSSYAEEMQ